MTNLSGQGLVDFSLWSSFYLTHYVKYLIFMIFDIKFFLDKGLVMSAGRTPAAKNYMFIQ
ncbi:MAG: hypothetical protein A2622_03205 [Bdellovibrionales bacterium RIFCSPHIGHO2_01_FULL_40_29]|nr:MAG: hypothetical protein A2622_03205 [Bdellovibrionales bacterium RIFCSPHIGHO2_01_FULL_40_29]OFZ34081.1 MAG: hypothetical protein A3D17_03625 [Bdellovibrionales bacterium RIFCSPHIGHO2_02_FULL_40_15]